MRSKFYHISTKVGMALSFICAIHCIVMPFLMMAYPFISNSFLHDPILEWSMLGGMIFLGLFSIQHYKKKHHNSNLPATLFGIGAIVCILALSILAHQHHIWMFVGASIIAVSQIMNLTMKRVIPHVA